METQKVMEILKNISVTASLVIYINFLNFIRAIFHMQLVWHHSSENSAVNQLYITSQKKAKIVALSFAYSQAFTFYYHFHSFSFSNISSSVLRARCSTMKVSSQSFALSFECAHSIKFSVSSCIKMWEDGQNV